MSETRELMGNLPSLTLDLSTPPPTLHRSLSPFLLCENRQIKQLCVSFLPPQGPSDAPWSPLSVENHKNEEDYFKNCFILQVPIPTGVVRKSYGYRYRAVPATRYLLVAGKISNH